jgi:RimJ/RimL family protein N-acetyltransferase
MITPKKPILTDLPLPIETPRLILRAVAAGDGAAIHEAKIETWDDLHKWMLWAKTLETVEETEAMAREHAAKFLAREDLMILAFEKATSKLVVSTGLHVTSWEARNFAIGYWTRKSAHGKGYATEVTNALLRYAFNVLSAERVGIVHADGNEASAAVIRKLGFEKEGILRRNTLLPDGTLVDSHVYSRLNLDNLPALDVRWGPT